jgi:hypothetical protein
MEELDDLLNGSLDIVENSEDNLFSEEEFNDILPGEVGNQAQWNRRVDVGDSGLGDSQWDEGATIDEIQNGLHDRRAELQPWSDQLGNAVAQAVVGEIIGGTIEGVGYLMDWQGIANLITGDEKEYTNWLSDIGKSIREETQDATQIYEKTPDEINLLDTGYWFKNSVSVASTLSMMLPAMAGGRIASMVGRGGAKLLAKGISKGGKKLGKEIAEEAVDLSKRMSKRADWAADGMTQAVISRHIENSMEASGTFEEKYNERMMQKNPTTGKYYTDEEARLDAAVAASDNYKEGWAMLAQDMIQYMGVGKVFNPATRQMETARKMARGADKFQKLKKAGQVVGTFVSEAGEEGYQHYISSKASLRSDLKAGLINQEEYDRQLGDVMNSNEAVTSMLFGGLGGSVFSAIGPKVNQAFKSKSRKEFEEKAAENYKAGLDSKNKIYAALNIEKARAEKKDNIEEREMAQDNIMAQMVIDGIDNDNLEMVMEAIKNGPEMTKEEKAKFAEDNNGQEWNQELAKAGAERALETAERIKAIHYKNLNRAKNKNVDKNIVKSMTQIEFQNEVYSEMFDKTKKDNKEVLNNLKYDGIRKPTQHFKDVAYLEAEMEATRQLTELYEKDHEEILDEDVKKHKAAIIKRHRSDLKELEKKHKELADPALEKAKSRDEKNGDELATTVFNNAVDKVIQGIAREKEINDNIAENEMKLSRLHDRNFQKRLLNAQTDALIELATDPESLKAFKKDVLKGNVTGYPSTKEKNRVVVAIDKKIAEIKAAERAAKKSENDAKDSVDKKNENDAKVDDVSIPDNNVVAPVQEALEDENAGEEIWFEDQFADKQQETLDVKTGNGKSISLLDGIGKDGKPVNGLTSPGYREWISSGKSKIGAKVRYEVNTKYSKYGPERAKKASIAFEKAKALGTKIPQEVYDYYPIKVFIGDGDSIWTHIPDASTAGGFYSNYEAERQSIINSLYNGVIPTTEIKHTAGGQLVTQVDENGVVAENNIKDLKQIKDSKKRPHIVFSNLDGDLMEMNKKDRNEDFPAKSLSVGKDKDGNEMPYRGGLFLILNKADGTKFPVRLNFLKNTSEQAEVLADLLIDIAVPVDKESAKKYKLNTPYSLLDDITKDRIQKAMPAEINFLKGDPSLVDLINMFVYMSKNTEGLTSQLYMSGVNLYFGAGENKGVVTPATRQQTREQLVDFLTNVKRRQLNINMWNDTKNFPGYRDFVLDNKIINTNVAISKKGEHEFQRGTYIDKQTGKEKTRYVKAFAAPIANTTPEVIPEVVTATNSIGGEQGAANTIAEENGASEAQINKAIADAYPGKMYNYGIQLELDGTAKTVMGGNVVPKEDLEGIQAIRDKMSGPTPSGKVKENIQDSDWNNFVDKGYVTTSVLHQLARKVKNNETLSVRETAIFADKTSEVEDILKSSQKNDTATSKPEKKDVSSQKIRKPRNRKNNLSSGASLQKKPTTSQKQSDNSVNKPDDTGIVSTNDCPF